MLLLVVDAHSPLLVVFHSFVRYISSRQPANGTNMNHGDCHPRSVSHSCFDRHPRRIYWDRGRPLHAVTPAILRGVMLGMGFKLFCLDVGDGW